jgi:hypothetical protein
MLQFKLATARVYHVHLPCCQKDHIVRNINDRIQRVHMAHNHDHGSLQPESAIAGKYNLYIPQSMNLPGLIHTICNVKDYRTQ